MKWWTKSFAQWGKDIYDGEFKLDKKQGKGIMYYANGDREMGDFMNDFPVGMHVKYCIDGKIKKVFY